MAKILINLCLTSTLTVFQLYRCASKETAKRQTMVDNTNTEN